LDHDSTLALNAAVALVNTDDRQAGVDSLATTEALTRWLDDERISGDRTGTDAELRAVRRLRARLREVFLAADAGDRDRVVDDLNELIRDAGALPHMVEHDGEPLHLHFTPSDAPVAHRLGAEMAVALARVVCDSGLDRLRVCGSPGCTSVLVDLSRNRSRRYCDARCANRQHVAAYRARSRDTGEESGED
jgi:predicted RNA-binding Zn ribbon-like protein